MIDRLGMIGVSWRQVGADSLAEFALSETSAIEQLQTFADRLHLSELGYLATCNRVELIFSRSDATPLRDLRRPAFELLRGRPPIDGEAERRLKAWQGEGAAEHLFLIAAGLDSACVGETEIVGQVRECHERAIDMGLSGNVLDLVFEEAQRIAARVRGETRLGEGRVSLAELAVLTLRQHAQTVEGPVALIGVSPMTERAARSLHSAELPMLFVNRTASKAAAAAQPYGAAHSSLDTFLASPPNVASVLASTGARDVVLPAPTLERIASAMPTGTTLLVVDMAVPPDVDAATCRKLGIRYIGMDEICARADENRHARLVESAHAREQVDDALGTLHDRFAEQYYGPLLGTLQNRYRHTAHEGVKRLLKKELKGLGDDERAAIEKWCEVLARRFAHIPCLGIRGLMHHGPDGSVEAFLSGLEPEFAEELRAALGTDSRSSREHR